MKNNLLVVGLLFFSLNLIFFKNTKTETNNIKAELNDSFNVKIVGEVNIEREFIFYHPVKLGDLIKYCYGFTKDANTNVNLNLLISEDKIITIYKNDDKTNNNDINTNNGLIDLNLATFDDIKNLNILNDNLIYNILDYRKENGKFKSIDELLKVNRIGQVTFNKIKDYFKV